MDVEELKKRKKNLKLTTADLAVLSGLPVGTVSKVMTGETKKPSYTTIEKIDKALSHEEFLARCEEYKRYFLEYVRNHPGEYVDPGEVEYAYRKEKGLNNDPILFATPVDNPETLGNLAATPAKEVTVNMLQGVEEDRFCELIGGKLIFDDFPGMRHQTIARNLERVINRFIEDNNGACEVYSQGINVRINKDDLTLVIPDVVVICNPEVIKDFGVWGAPDWVIEVISKSTKQKDYIDKMYLYMSAGVREYWIIDPDRERVTVYIEGSPMMTYIFTFDDDIPVHIYDGKLRINMKTIV